MTEEQMAEIIKRAREVNRAAPIELVGELLAVVDVLLEEKAKLLEAIHRNAATQEN